MTEPSISQSDLVQLHLVHPYTIEIRQNARVKRYLASGYDIKNLQRVSDREVLVTLGRGQVLA